MKNKLSVYILIVLIILIAAGSSMAAEGSIDLIVLGMS